MDVLKAIKERRSIRKYVPQEIPGEHLKEILEAARLSPSAGNRQPWSFIVVKDRGRRENLAEAARNQMWAADADVIIAALGDYSNSLGRYAKWVERDIMIAVENMVLAAKSMGYGTCWIGAFEEEEVKRILNIPEGPKVVVLLPIGVPAESPMPKPRKEVSDIFYAEEFGRRLEI